MIATTTLLLLLNTVRQPGLPLKSDIRLDRMAQVRCMDMQLFSHDNNPAGKMIYDLKYFYVGEILANGFPDATSTIKAWEASPNHNSVMKSKEYSRVGVAHCNNLSIGYTSVMLFGGYQKKPIWKK